MTTIEEFMKTATKEQRDLLFEMSDLAEKENNLATRINKIYGSIQGGVLVDRDGISVCEDEDDAMVISIGPRQELKNVREQMKRCMRKAVELGMSHVGLIERNYEHYTGEALPA